MLRAVRAPADIVDALVRRKSIVDLGGPLLDQAIAARLPRRLYLFGSREGLVSALLTRARTEELALLTRADHPDKDKAGALGDVALSIWSWLVSAEHRALLRLWVEAYARSLVDPGGPWGSFARSTVDDWLAVLADAQSPAERDTPDGCAERTLVLAVLRGALLDLLATGDVERTTACVERYLAYTRTLEDNTRLDEIAGIRK